jgi:hypothetical protein
MLPLERSLIRERGECSLLHRYMRSDQNQLEQFMITMYASRGFVFDAEGLHSDIRRIEPLYPETGGGFWLLKKLDEPNYTIFKTSWINKAEVGHGETIV